MTEKKDKSNRTYQDSLFQFLFGTHRNREFALDLYNTVNHTDYTNADDIKFVTLNDMLFVKMKNDVGFILYDRLNLWEAQSGWNYNLPLRNLLYGTDEIRRNLHERGLKPARNAKIPLSSVRCVAFYSGDKKVEDGTVLFLSDNMQPNFDDTDLQVKVRVYNIGRNIDLLNSCRSAHEYSLITTDIKDFMAEGYSREDAVRKALEKVDSSYVLYPIVCSEYDEVRDMLNREYTLEEALKDRMEEGRVEGRAEGRAEGHTEGRTEGRDEKTMEFIVAMLEEHESLKKIIRYSGSDEETIRSVAEKYGLHVEE